MPLVSANDVAGAYCVGVLPLELGVLGVFGVLGVLGVLGVRGFDASLVLC
jgi:hypothetical protein